MNTPTAFCACGCGKPRTGNRKYFSDQCRKNFWLSVRRTDEDYRAEHRKYMRTYNKTHTPKPKAKVCTCNQYSRCLQCRNRERRAAFREDRIPVYRLTMTQAASD